MPRLHFNAKSLHLMGRQRLTGRITAIKQDLAGAPTPHLTQLWMGETGGIDGRLRVPQGAANCWSKMEPSVPNA